MRRSRKLIAIAAAAAVVVLVLACGVFALVPRRAPVAIATRQEVEQRAVQMAQDQFAGTVTTLATRATTQGEVNPQRCSSIRWLGQQTSVIAGTRAWNWCNDDMPMWEATMQGEFRSFDGNTVRALQMTFGPDGNVSTMIEGPVVEER